MKKFLTLLWVLPLIGFGFSITLDGTWTGIIKYCGEKILTLDCEDGKEITFPASVPGGIYTDLSKLNLIADNLHGKNDVNNRWISNQNVTYFRNFDASNKLLNSSRVVLVFHGLDTFATISLNGQEIGRASNMFVRYTFDATNQLRKGKNLLKVSFSPAVKVAKDLYNKQAAEYVVPPKCVPDEYNGECHVNHIRKMQASFAWDWGPAFPSMGIWKSVELIPVKKVLITDITTDIVEGENKWNILVTIFFQVTPQEDSTPISCHIVSSLRVNEKLKVQNSSIAVLKTDDRYTSATISLEVPAELVDRWWPNGYGDQNLYKLTITVTKPNNIFQREMKIGFRTVELVQEPLSKGLSFYFRVNGVPIFAKGSNFIPASIFPELGAKGETIRHLLTSAKEAHMNMLRVWGGGLYESDLFYDLADEYGIMIWQDFMFACGMYPTNEEFLKSVKEEVVQNMRRLKNHPSIVLWAGNNENEAALYGNWYETGTKQVYKTDYVKLYVGLIKNEVEKLDFTRPFVVSSPSNGLYSEKYNFTGEDPYSKLYGDVHYYNYISNGWNMHQYPRARFSSEYGFQSLPSIYTLAPVVDRIPDLNVDNDFMRHRQHLPYGTSFMKGLISKNFRIPHTNNTLKDFRDFIYLSQINQAVSMRIQTESYRQAMSEVNEIGQGMTMGALYWQLNDVWQAPSWSSIDIDGRWKMLHYYAADFFAPIIVTYYITNNNLSIYIVSDQLHPLKDTTLEIKLYKWNEMSPKYSLSCRNITIEPLKAKRIDNDCLKNSLLSSGLLFSNNENNSILKSDSITTLTLNDKNGSQIAPTNYIYETEPFKSVGPPLAEILVQVKDYHLPGKYANYPDIEIELTTTNIAFFVWLETGNIRGRFSENGFHMMQNKKRITFHAREIITPEVLKEDMRVTSLSDIYNSNVDTIDE